MLEQAALKSRNVFDYLQTEQQKFAGSFFIASEDEYRGVTVGFPFRTFMYGIGLNYSAHHAEVQIGSTIFETQSGSLSTVGPGIVCQWLGGSGGQFDTVYFAEDIFLDETKNNWLRSLPSFQPGGNHMIRINDLNRQQLKDLFIVLKQFRNNRSKAVEVIYSMLLVVAECHSSPGLQANTSFAVHQKVANHFQKRLAECYLQQKSVAFYAKELHLPPKYLSEILQTVTGRSAKTIILDYILLEAKSLLRQTTMSVQDISIWLGYDDFSYFTKVFRKKEGITPLAYRKLPETCCAFISPALQ
ncbi:MAG: helix-turn-helix domain-containing protein [Pseudobacter sp.]|uniref:helix-turn-helix domain-containing protein n=1 Tax=Pseudobacter sp. TaxID=2045420 RepID=UPI003F7D2EEF